MTIFQNLRAVSPQVWETIEMLLPWPFFTTYRRLKRLARAITMGEETIEQQVEKASQALSDAAQLTTQLQGRMEAQKQDLKLLMDETRRYRDIAKIAKKDAKDVLDEIGNRTKKERILGWLGALIITGFFFWLGTVVGGG